MAVQASARASNQSTDWVPRRLVLASPGISLVQSHLAEQTCQVCLYSTWRNGTRISVEASRCYCDTPCCSPCELAGFIQARGRGALQGLCRLARERWPRLRAERYVRKSPHGPAFSPIARRLAWLLLQRGSCSQPAAVSAHQGLILDQATPAFPFL